MKRARALILAFVCVGCSGVFESAPADPLGDPSLTGVESEWSAQRELDGARDLVSDVDRCITNPDPQSPSETTVWMRPGVTVGEVERVKSFFDQHSDVADYTYVDREQTSLEFRESYAEEPELFDLIDRDQLPTSFRFRIDRTELAKSLGSELETLQGVSSIIYEAPPRECEAEIAALAEKCDAVPDRQARNGIVRLDIGIDNTVAGNIEQVLAGDHRIRTIEYINSDETYQTILKGLAHDPELADLLDPNKLPTSFEFVTEELTAEEIKSLAADLETQSPAISSVEILLKSFDVCSYKKNLELFAAVDADS